MNEKKKAEWKGMFKGVVVTLLLLGVFSAGVAYAGVTLMADEGFFVGDTSMIDGKVTINSTEITGDSFGDVLFLTYGNISEKTYAVGALPQYDNITLEIHKEIEFVATGNYVHFGSPMVTAKVKSDEATNELRVGLLVGIFDAKKNVGDSAWNDYVVYEVTYATTNAYTLIYSDTGNSNVVSVTPGNTYYAYIFSYASTSNAGGSQACTAYLKEVTASATIP